MTPFGVRVRQLRGAKKLQLQEMARDLQVSSAYLSALEHGRRGRPQPGLVMQIANYFELIPTDVIHDTLAHFRRVMEASRSGMVRRSFQAMQQASTMAS